MTHEERKAEMVRLYNDGVSLRQIAARLGMTGCTIAYHLKRMGHMPASGFRKGIRWTPELVARLAAEYPVDGPDKLAAELCCSPSRITKEASARGIGMVDRFGKNREVKRIQAEQTTAMNVNFFDSWSPEVAYVLGYFWADGCIKTCGGVPCGLSFLCSETDRDFLQMIADAIGYAKPLVRVVPKPAVNKYRNKTYQSKPIVRFDVNTVAVANKLIANHGLMPRKSAADLPLPDNVPDELMSHFARGNLDGDGSIVIRHKEKRATISFNGSDHFITGLGERITRLTSASPPGTYVEGLLRRISWQAKADVIKIGDWLYQDCTMCLQRKRNKYEEAKRLLDQVNGYSKRRRDSGTVHFT